MAVECAQVDCAGHPTSRASHPNKPVARRHCGADRRREQHRHLLGLPLVPKDAIQTVLARLIKAKGFPENGPCANLRDKRARARVRRRWRA